MNKRYYEHTLPIIRGSLSNTYIGLLWNRLTAIYWNQIRKGNILPLSQYSTNRKQLSDGEEKLIEISPTN